jgi:hypothetical protein
MANHEDLATLVMGQEDRIHIIRQSIRNFCRTVDTAIIDGRIHLGSLYDRYGKMQPCLHPHCNDKSVVDINAWNYALQRLPEEVARAKEIYIQSKPEDLRSVDGINSLSCKARRRTMYERGEGYLSFIAREGSTDIFDIVTSLIMYGKEAEKIKWKLREDSLAREIKDLADTPQSEEKNQVLARLSSRFGTSYHELHKVDASLDYKLFSIITKVMDSHPDHIEIRFDSEFSKTDAPTKAKYWRERIEKELKDENRPLIMISSNTHSVVNCLTGFAMDHKDHILQLAEDCGCTSNMDTSDPSSVYFLLQKLSKINKELLEEKIAYEDKLGIRLLRDTSDTGIDVQIIDTARIDPSKIDPRINVMRDLKNNPPLILNLDYAFGKQGTDIMRELCEAFQKRIESISITGKAGIVCGSKYDIMLPNYLLPQIDGGIYEFPKGRNSLRKEDIAPFVTQEQVFSGGPMLTVPGTAIQNDLLLQYYMVTYGILGLEMEGVPYLEAIEKAHKRGILRDNIMLNVGYWGSDNPLSTADSLAEDHMDRGFIPTYAIIIGILNKALNNGG